MSRRAGGARLAAAFAWLALAVSIVTWPVGETGIGWPHAALALLPLLLPAAGIARGSERVYRWAPLALTPALALAVTELLVNAAARTRAAATLALVLAAFAAMIAALRTAPRGKKGDATL